MMDRRKFLLGALAATAAGPVLPAIADGVALDSMAHQSTLWGACPPEDLTEQALERMIIEVQKYMVYGFDQYGRACQESITVMRRSWDDYLEISRVDD